MATYLGWDIGGVHLKLSRLSCSRPGAAAIRTFVVPFEIWKDPGGLAPLLSRMLSEAGPESGAPPVAAAHAVTMTAELSDVFPTRAEGVRAILAACAEALVDAPVSVLDLDGALRPLGQARETPLACAAANWMATASVAARAAGSGPAVLIDVGSTTTDVVALRDGRPIPAGRTDTARLRTGELVYSGLQRTHPASFTDAVPLQGGWCRLASEHFAITADVYRLLGRIDEADYTASTPDGRGRGRDEAAARLSRLVCADASDLGSAVVAGLASYLEDRQVDQLARAVRQVLSRHPDPPAHRAVVAGAGAFLAEAAAARAGLAASRLGHLVTGVSGGDWDVAAPSGALALLLAEEAGELRLPAAGGRA